MTTTSLGSGAQVTAAFGSISDDDAREHLEKYFGLGAWEGKEYEGAHFERLGRRVPDELTADDIVAVSCLSIHIPAKGALGILGEHAAEITELLSEIPVDLALEELPLDDHEKYFGDASAAIRLWRLLRAHGRERWGVGPTATSKLMARKRPALFPIYDSVVGRVTGFRDSLGIWRAWHEAFALDSAFVERIRSLQSATGLHDISLLRILDVVLWMYGSQGVRGPEIVDLEEEG
ncbi:DUF6308 family protein [Sinomonas gamaensis]|uniref:DUF6308 family protein n=1 Tax=Sinomonas gamaensis TaxID=2565624 RepID=UPI001109A557|nr:DUF6308 family protein [Sinomonas gamaensis]